MASAASAPPPTPRRRPDAPKDEPKGAFCYHCMKVGHFPRDCPARGAKDDPSARPDRPSKPSSDPAAKAKKAKKKANVLEIPGVPKASDVRNGDLVFESMVNNNALIKAAYNGDAEEAQRHIKRGADVNAFDSNGLAPLHIAAIYGHHVCITMLISNGADPNIADKLHSRTPIHLAASLNMLPCVKALLSAGADPTKLCDMGETAFDKCKSPSVKYVMDDLWKGKSS